MFFLYLEMGMNKKKEDIENVEFNNQVCCNRNNGFWVNSFFDDITMMGAIIVSAQLIIYACMVKTYLV